MNKRGGVGFSITTMYRILMVIIVGVVVLGASSIVYSHHINVRDSEAMIMVREISDCVIDGGVVDLSKLDEGKNIFEYCGFDEKEVELFFVSVSVTADGAEVFAVESGDSGLRWIRDLYDSVANIDAIERYEPGHFERGYDVLVLAPRQVPSAEGNSGIEKDGELVVEVILNAE